MHLWVMQEMKLLGTVGMGEVGGTGGGTVGGGLSVAPIALLHYFPGAELSAVGYSFSGLVITRFL